MAQPKKTKQPELTKAGKPRRKSGPPNMFNPPPSAVVVVDGATTAQPRMGRPTKLTPEVQTRIVSAILTGAYIETAAAACGLNRETFYEWLRRGARAGDDPADELYKNFSNAINEAVAQSELMDVAIITRAAQTEWQASAWKLERRAPERWGRRARFEHEVAGTQKPNEAPTQTQVLRINGREIVF